MAGSCDKIYEKQRVTWKNLHDHGVKKGPVGSNFPTLQSRTGMWDTARQSAGEEGGQE
jgi:hypothetical protein